jgi:hypothetical protein
MADIEDLEHASCFSLDVVTKKPAGGQGHLA